MKPSLLLSVLLALISIPAQGALLFSQPPIPTSGFIPSCWWQPLGSDYDQYVWESFSTPSTQNITEIQWRGGFAQGGSGGPVVDFAVKIFGSTSEGIQPDILAGALVDYSTGGNALQTLASVTGGVTNYAYRFTLPTPFQANAGTKYWLEITAAQSGTPDWGFAVGAGGDGTHIVLTPGTHLYLPATHDFAFGLATVNSGYAITTSASPPNGGLTSGDGEFISNAVATVVAVPNPGFTFVNWTSNGQVVSSQSTYSFPATAPRNLTANFTSTCVITTSASPSNGGTTSGGGTLCLGTNVTVRAVPNSGFGFLGWAEGTASGPIVSKELEYGFIAASNRTLVANFRQLFTITAIASPVEGGSVTGGGDYFQSSNATLSAAAAAGYQFTNWTIGGVQVSTSATYRFSVIGNRTFTANFIRLSDDYTISTTVIPAGGGSTTGGGIYTNGAEVTLTATANPGYVFVSWMENGVSLTNSDRIVVCASTNRSLAARFSPVLNIALTSTNKVILSWPAPLPEYAPQQTPFSTPTEWQSVTNEAVTVNGRNLITLPPTERLRLFRLFHP